MRTRILLLLAILVLSMPATARAQDTSAPYVWTSGLLNSTDHSVFYSVFVYSGDHALSDLTVSGHLPPAATLYVFSGVRKGQLNY